MVQILLVDAAAEEAACFGEALRSGSTGDRPIEVIACSNPRDAVAVAARQGCDVVVADLNLPRPGWSGSYVLRRVRELCPRVRTYLISETDAWAPLLREAADGVIFRQGSSEDGPAGLAEQLFRALHTGELTSTEIAERPAEAHEPTTADSSRLAELRSRSSGVGDLIAGKYQLTSELGHGGMGVVYRAVDTFIGRQVAVKLLKFPAFLVGDQMRDRMRREVTITGRLSHPNLVTVFDAGIDRGELYIVLELIDGQSLREILLERPQWPLHETLGLAAQILDALDHSHSLGIVHRDLKPGNILVTTDGRAKVVDFGIAKLVSLAAESTTTPITTTDMTSPGTILGTPAYMAPEQLMAEEIDARADLYSLGAVIFELLHGCSLSAIFSPFSRAPRAPLPVLAGNSRLTALIEKALARNPAERFGSAAEMKAALAEIERPETGARRSWWPLGKGK